MKETLDFLMRHGYAVLVATVFAEQLGVPIPAVPILLAMGALAGAGHFSFVLAITFAVTAAMVADAIWYEIGRRRGHPVLKFLCRVSLEPDSCVSSTRNAFRRAGAWALVIAKFVPGLSTLAPPLAGVSRMSFWKFAAATLAGSTIWVVAFMSIGYAFHSRIDAVAAELANTGGRVVALLGVLLVLYLLFKWYQRRRFIRTLLVARVTPEDVINRLPEVTVLDMRSEFEVREQGFRLPGAMWFDRRRLEELHQGIPRDRDVILYCS
jgi:membrane protein DedA with SNARE-associated domain